MRPTEGLDDSSIAQLRALFELLDRWEREVPAQLDQMEEGEKQ
jgi:hypothetical protein